MKTTEYYFEDGSHVIFDKYDIDTSGNIKNKKSGQTLSQRKSGKYNRCSLQDNKGRTRSILVGRAVLSTFIGRPPTTEHTADHIDRDPNNDTLGNIRWLCKSDQSKNRTIPEALKSAFIIVKDNQEMTVKEWVVYLKDQITPFGNEYSSGSIIRYAQRKQYGFSYKEYQDLPGEVWKEISFSRNDKGGRWEISDMNRVKYITKYAENLFSGERISLDKGYPSININNKRWSCHTISFMTFFPEVYATKKPTEMVLHEDDNRLDFRPYKLRLGTASVNGNDAHNNGRRNGTKTARMKCVSCVDELLEETHDSQSDACKYLKSIGYGKACIGKISQALRGLRRTAYGRTWRIV